MNAARKRNKPSVGNYLVRFLAVFVASGLSVISTGILIGVELWKAVLMAGVGGLATVLEGIARAAIADGSVSHEEIDKVFRRVGNAEDDGDTESL